MALSWGMSSEWATKMAARCSAQAWARVHTAASWCGLAAAPLVAVQRGALGRVLAPLVPPGTSWVVAGTEDALVPVLP